MALSKNLFYNFLLSLSHILFPLISIPYISRVLNPEGVGQVSFIDAFTYYFIAIAEFGIIVYAVREVAKNRNDPDKLSRLVSELLCLHFISSSCALVLYGISVYFLWNHFQDIRLVLFSISFLLVNFFACEWYFWGKEEFRYLTFRSLLVRTLGLISLFLIIKEPADYYLYYLIIAASAVAALIWNLVVLFSEIPVSFKNINWRRHVPFVFTTFQVSILYSVIIMLDNVLLGIVATTASVAFYHFSIKIVRLAGIVVTDMLLVLYPRMISLVKDNQQEKMGTMITESTGFLVLLTMPVSVGIFFLSGPFTRLYFGDNFSVIAFNLKLLAFYPLIRVLALSLNKQILMVHEKDKYVVKGLLISCLFFIAAFTTLSRYFQDKGACIAILLTELVIFLMNFHYVRKLKLATKIFDKKDLWHAAAGSVLLVPLIIFIKTYFEGDLLIIITSSFAGAAFYLFFTAYILRNRVLQKVFITLTRFVALKNPGNG